MENREKKRKGPYSDNLSHVFVSWRTDPAESYSDWKLHVVEKGEQEPFVQEYNVHRCFLGSASAYFNAQFKSDRFVESQNNTTKLEGLSELEVARIPDFLDYLYSPCPSDFISVENATVMHNFGNYFAIPQLCRDAMNFIDSTLSVDNAHEFYAPASCLNDEEVKLSVINFCIENLYLLSSESPIIEVSDEHMWRNILWSSEDPDELSDHKSDLLASFMKHHKIDFKTFIEFTTEDVLPDLSPSSATEFLLRSETFEESDAPELVALQDRCLQVLTEHWSDIADARVELLEGLSGKLMFRVFSTCTAKWKSNAGAAQARILFLRRNQRR